MEQHESRLHPLAKALPDPEIMYRALVNRDSHFEGIFITAVKSTGIFCRPTCRAKIPKREHVEFFSSAHEALQHGYRPCKLCRPLAPKGEIPAWLQPVLAEIEATHPRLSDADLRARGLVPSRVRAWFKRQHGMTFQAYLRALRINQAMGRIRFGASVTGAALDSGYESLSGFGAAVKKHLGAAPSRGDEAPLVLTRILTPLGPMLAGASAQGICLLEFTDRRMLETQLATLKRRHKTGVLPGTSPFFALLDTQMREYFAGARRDFSVPLDVRGTPFQQAVWTELQRIPYAATRSYAEQAEAIGRRAAVRAVARANGDNRIAVIIPCHRVIGADGKLVGYGGGLWRKKYLLALEAEQGK
jgi:AraC family transcriptional regulator, regulatory protein of adaptative response / methylated-DNA-[protein]-cysteine methyltransferase